MWAVELRGIASRPRAPTPSQLIAKMTKKPSKARSDRGSDKGMGPEAPGIA